MTIQENIDLIYAELMRIKLSLGGESCDVSEEIAELNDAIAALEVKAAVQGNIIADNEKAITANTANISNNKADIAALEADKQKKIYQHNFHLRISVSAGELDCYITKFSTNSEPYTKDNFISAFKANENLIIGGSWTATSVYPIFCGVKIANGFKIRVNKDNTLRTLTITDLSSATRSADVITPV